MIKYFYMVMIFILTVNPIFAWEDISTALSNMTEQLKNEKKNLELKQAKLKYEIKTQKKTLIKIEKELDMTLFNIKLFKKGFDSCYDDYDLIIKKLRANRDIQKKKFPKEIEEINNQYFDYIDYSKSDLKKCSNHFADKLAELKGMNNQLNSMREEIEMSRNSIPRLEHRLRSVSKKLLRLMAEINALEGK